MKHSFTCTRLAALWLLITLGFFPLARAGNPPPSHGTVDALEPDKGLIVIDDRLMQIADDLIIHVGKTSTQHTKGKVHVGDLIGYRAEFTGGDGAVRWVLHEIWILDAKDAHRARKGPPMQLPGF